MEKNTAGMLARYADEYECASFLEGDPSWFMHQVEGRNNREATAFVASCLSFGSRKQFMPKIQWLADCAGGNIYDWIVSGRFEGDVSADGDGCFYRFYTFSRMNLFFRRMRSMLRQYESIGGYVRSCSDGSGMSAVSCLCRWFSTVDSGRIVPVDTKSACKRVCMFLRWMVRDGSPVDLGLWADFIDKRTLIMPLDTHVLQQSARLGLINNKNATMTTARRLTDKLAEVFPDDPLKGDFALFGYGVSHAIRHEADLSQSDNTD